MKYILIFLAMLVVCTGSTYSQELKVERWKEFRSKEANVQAMFPGDPTLTKDSVDGAHGYQVFLSFEDRAYVLLATDAPISTKPTEDVLKLGYAASRDSLLSDHPGSKLISERSMTIDGKSGYEVEFETKQHFLKYRFLWSDGRLYEVGTASRYSLKNDPEAQADFKKFLDSFRLFTPN